MDQSEQLRIRVTFNNGVLTKPQKKDGLKHSWVLLKPYFETISDVVSYIVHSFDLHRSCPDGVILSMDGFVLPEFESISILKDTDIISVKRKETRLLEGGNKARVEDVIVEKLPLAPGVQLLANEEFDKQTVEDEDEDEDQVEDEEEEEGEVRRSPVKTASDGDVACKKRKSSSKTQSAKKKRKIQATVHASDETITKPRKKRKHEHKSNKNTLSTPDVVEKCSKNDDLMPESNSKSELDENKEDPIQASPKPDKPKRVCRATFRKKQKRDYKRLQKEEAKKVERLLQLCGGGQKPVKDMTLDTGAILDAVAKVAQQPDDDDDSDEDGELVPVEIRPGLIRFTSSAKAKDVQEMKEANAVDAHLPENGALDEHSAPKSVSDNQVAKEPYCWNGITNKKKGQKWGQTSTWKDSRNGNNTNSSNSWGDGRNQSTSSSYQESTEINGELNRKWADKKYLLYKLRVDFDKLIPLVDLPKAGDVLAYRLLELSSSWCPELSEFRVGKIASFEPESNMVKLVPVPEYPLNIRKKNDDAEVDVVDADESPLGSSTYNDDGSLETDFTSLNDVRIIKLGESTRSKGANGSSTPTTTAKKDNGVQGSNAKKVASDVGNQEPPTAGLANGKKPVSEETMSAKKTATPSSNGKKDVWDEISEAMSAKKAQLMQEDKWNKKKAESQTTTAVRRPWSYRSLRSSAIGPTMARLREQNGV